MKINRTAEPYDQLSVVGNGNELQLYVIHRKGEPLSITVYWMDDDGREFEMEPGKKERIPFLESLRDWSNDQIWKMRHEEAAA